MQTNRIWFLQFARAIACLLIVYVHWMTFMLNPNALIPNLHQSPLQQYPQLFWSTDLYGLVPAPFREVYFSLALFFLISGYVIPLSLEKSNPFIFLFRRFMRIYPTLFVCTFITAGMILVGRYLDGLSLDAITSQSLFSNLGFVRDVFHQPFVENATWTLEIEVHFYLLCFLLAFFNGQHRALAILSLCGAFLLGQYWLHNHVAAAELPESITLNLSYINLMFIGTCLYNWHKQVWKGTKTVLMLLALVAINSRLIGLSPLAIDVIRYLYVNNIFALACFFILLMFNERLAYSKFLDKLANISYPLYLVHGFTGYVFFFIVFKWTHSAFIAFAVAATLIVSMAFLLHRLVEMPGIQLSKQVVGYFTKRRIVVKDPVVEAG